MFRSKKEERKMEKEEGNDPSFFILHFAACVIIKEI
jgi:hypothetical protein